MANQKNVPSAFFDVLGNSGFRSLWLAQVFSQLAVSMTMFVLALRVYQLTGSSTAVSGLFLTFGVPAFIFAMAAGAIVDHFDKRTILIISDIARAILAVGFLFASGRIAVVYGLALLYSIITQFYTPSLAPTIPRLVKDAQLVTANSIFSFTFYASLAVGSILAGPVLRWFGPYGVFIVILLLFVLAAVNNSRVPREIGKRPLLSALERLSVERVVLRVVSSVSEGVSYVFSSPKLFDGLILLTGTQVTLGLLATLGPAFADRMLEIDIHDASVLIVGPVVVGIILGAIWVGHAGQKLGEKRLIETGIMAAGILLVLIAATVYFKRFGGLSWLFTQNIIVPLEFFLFFLLGIANSLLDVPANSVLQKEAQGDMRGRVYGILTAVVGGIGILPVVASGVLADLVGVGKVIFILGVTIVAYGIYRIRYNKLKIKNYVSHSF